MESLCFLFSEQRQRLRELLIRQQIQRNTLRQEKETAAAAAGAVGPPATWSAEPNSPAFEQLNRGQTPFPGTQVDRAVSEVGVEGFVFLRAVQSHLLLSRTRIIFRACPQASWVAPSWDLGLFLLMKDFPGHPHQPLLPLWM